MRGSIVKISLSFIFLLLFFYFSSTVQAADAEKTDHVLISEVYYNPIQTGTDTKYEWVEIYNNTNVSVDLANWSLKDNTNSSVLSANSYILEPANFLVIAAYEEFFKVNFPVLDPKANIIYLEHSIGNGLSNSGDILQLLDGGGNIVDEVIWNSTNSKELIVGDGQSIERVPVDGSFAKNLKPSPGALPLPVVETTPDTVKDEIVDIAIIRGEEDGSKAIISGVVSVLPNVLSTQYFYIQDETGGIQIYNYHKIFPTIILGDKITVNGELSTVSGERRMKITQSSDIKILENIAKIIAEPVQISAIDEKYEGKYIKTTGFVVETSGDNFVIGEKKSNKTVKVTIRESANIDKPKMKKGDEVEISGIVSEYKGEYKILPTKQEDVKVLTSGYLPMAGPSEFMSLIFGTIIYTLWILFQKTKKKHLILAGR
jgi:DNA/RNA endonuclease YhcR with UshA esterase domain